jgi:uncharacterized membrane protein
MQKSIEERLGDLESGISKLTKMQGSVFKALSVLHKTLSTVSTKSTNQDSFFVLLPLLFGIAALASFVCSLFSLYLVTHDIGFKVFGIVFGVFGILLVSIYYPTRRSVNRQLRETKKTMAALEDDFAQVVAEWKKLAPDDLVSEPKSED